MSKIGFRISSIEQTLSNATDVELLAALLGRGAGGLAAIDSSRRLLKRLGGLRGLLLPERAALIKSENLSRAQLKRILSFKEFHKRLLRQEILGRSYIKEPECILRYLKETFCDESREWVRVLFLDGKQRLLEEHDLVMGAFNEVRFSLRGILQTAFEIEAAYLVLVHNHPSGCVEPSLEDRKTTQTVSSVCQKVGLKLIDHIIVAGRESFSFASAGLI